VAELSGGKNHIVHTRMIYSMPTAEVPLSQLVMVAFPDNSEYAARGRAMTKR
jgi:hypothetical protein